MSPVFIVSCFDNLCHSDWVKIWNLKVILIFISLIAMDDELFKRYFLAIFLHILRILYLVPRPICRTIHMTYFYLSILGHIFMVCGSAGAGLHVVESYLIWVLETEPESSWRTASCLNWWAAFTSSALSFNWWNENHYYSKLSLKGFPFSIECHK